MRRLSRVHERAIAKLHRLYSRHPSWLESMVEHATTCAIEWLRGRVAEPRYISRSPDPTWSTKPSGVPISCHDEWHGAKGSAQFDGRALASYVWGDHAHTRCSGLLALAYMVRRFGPSELGCDPHKDLSSYILTTPDPDVRMALTLSGSPLSSAVGYWTSIDWAVFCRRDLVDRHRAKLGCAISATMTDLLRPVAIRDVPINILGVVPYDTIDHDTDFAQPFEYAGYGVERRWFESVAPADPHVQGAP